MRRILKKILFWFDQFTGAFSDAAIMLPLLILLVQSIGYSSACLMMTAGSAYVIVGLYFRIPMPIQPLKSLVLTAVALSASLMEVRLATLLFGGICLFLWGSGGSQFLNLLPKRFIHGIQLSLGIILILKAVNLAPEVIFCFPVLALFLWRLPSQFILGGIVLTGFVMAVWEWKPLLPPVQIAGDLRIEVLAFLILPQICLTLTNSVAATRVVAQHYFGDRAHRVTHGHLLASIGFGNLITGALGGLPFCHGSGGMTAHVRGGASHYCSNLIIGSVLLGLGALISVKGDMSLCFVPLITALLLATIGGLHMELARPSLKSRDNMAYLGIVAGTALLSQSLFWAILAALLLESSRKVLNFIGEKP